MAKILTDIDNGVKYAFDYVRIKDVKYVSEVKVKELEDDLTWALSIINDIGNTEQIKRADGICRKHGIYR